MHDSCFSDFWSLRIKGQTNIDILTFTIDGRRSGSLVKASDFWFAIVGRSCRVFVHSISVTSTFPWKLAQNTHKQRYITSTPALQIVNHQQTAMWQMHTVTWLNTYLHFYYSYVVLFCFVLLVSCAYLCRKAQNNTLRFFFLKPNLTKI